jgi:hypothetical protein
LEIETDFPELYRFLDENPITIPIDRYPQINKKVLQDYLQSLKPHVVRFKLDWVSSEAGFRWKEVIGSEACQTAGS